MFFFNSKNKLIVEKSIMVGCDNYTILNCCFVRLNFSSFTSTVEVTPLNRPPLHVQNMEALIFVYYMVMCAQAVEHDEVAFWTSPLL